MERKCEICGKLYKAALFGYIKNCECVAIPTIQKQWNIKVRDEEPKLFYVEDGSMLHQVLCMDAGTKLTLTCYDIFNDPYHETVTYMGEVQQHGYTHGSGSWSLYGSIEKGDNLCFKIMVRPFRKQRCNWMKLEYQVKAIKTGW